jgi:threonine/homoserine/homoserine lactone efflux protein
MPDKAPFLTFLVAAFLLNIAPGPDMLYVIGRSVGQGRKAGVVSALGIFVGCLVHIALATAGIAALLRSSPLAFNVIRYAGARTSCISAGASCWHVNRECQCSSSAPTS